MKREEVLRAASAATWEDDNGDTMRLALGLVLDADATMHVFRGSEMGPGWVWHDAPAPDAGDSARMSDMLPEGRYSSYGGTEYVEIPYTAYGDYLNGTVERANLNALLEDYPDTFVVATGDYWSRTLYLPAYAAISEYLYDAIVSLRDYPVYDEQALSELEFQLQQEAWDEYGETDLRDEVAEAITGECRSADLVEGVIPDAEDLYDLLRDDWEDSGFYPYCEDAAGACVLWADGAPQRIADRIMAEYVNDPRVQCDGQTELAV